MALSAFISALPKIRRQQVAHAHEVVTGERKQCGVFDLVATAELRSSQQADVLAPAEGFLDELPRPQAQRVAGVNNSPFLRVAHPCCEAVLTSC
jgi:hypothetical protein